MGLAVQLLKQLALVVGALGCFVVIRIVQVYRQMQKGRTSSKGFATPAKASRSSSQQPCKTLVVLGSGGHTSEMLHMVRQMDVGQSYKYRSIHYVVAATDHTSVQRLEAIMSPFCSHNDDDDDDDNDQQEQQAQAQEPLRIHTIPRSREVGQSYASSLVTTLYALLHSIVLTFQIRPELLLTNGPGTCVPIVMGCWMLRILGWPCTIVFCESYCRVDTLSLSGKILYPLVDCFLVHWESLHDKYPRSYRLSTFVRSSSSSSLSSSLPSSKQETAKNEKKSQ